MKMRALSTVFVAIAWVLAAASAPAQTPRPDWSALAADRTAASVGDSVTVIIVEASSAGASTESATGRGTQLSGSLLAGGQVVEAGGLGAQGAFDGRGRIQRSGRLVGQIGATVQEVLPNGDLRIEGSQTLIIDGETTKIHLTGRVRPADLAGDNTVLSSRLADAAIRYEGDGALSRSGRHGVIESILSWLGLL
jgi:flagellar L-ring protein precursor FlgH